MKNSKIRRFLFEISANSRFLMFGLKNPTSFIYKNKFRTFFGRFWSFMYSNISGVKSEYYVPETFFYNNLECKVNDFSLSSYFEHKGYLDKILMTNTVPSLINCMSGVMYSGFNVIGFDEIEELFKDYNNELVIKRSIGTGGGKSVEIGIYSDIKCYIKEYYESGYDFIIQNRLSQHPELEKYNQSSLNTIRMLTLSIDGNVNLLSSVFRMGNGGKIDNSASGGISIGMSDSGVLNDFAIDHDFNKFYEHPLSKISFLGKDKIPFFYDMKDLVILKHKELKSHDLVSWDLTVDDDGYISIIEFNVVWSEINFHQANNGPIFENYIEYLNRFRK
ncbi:hypothetical protein GNP73_00305 [Aliivibrio fischeri]|uniref:sugar-transfer associated ATP-grasp domain-containing protein n=1 Tax=Aliivibrio fischeri TaxID=668 RepID=UPI0012DAC735|nr:sugar-transfer associated ATP-grasp domain-containing protein [Aliivibrio fischeri]MUJ26426.1 hypothetical protein [Aliivibrio fischeri]